MNKKTTIVVEIRDMLPAIREHRFFVRVLYVEGNANWDYKGPHDLGLSLSDAQHFAFKIRDAIKPENLK